MRATSHYSWLAPVIEKTLVGNLPVLPLPHRDLLHRNASTVLHRDVHPPLAKAGIVCHGAGQEFSAMKLLNGAEELELPLPVHVLTYEWCVRIFLHHTI